MSIPDKVLEYLLSRWDLISANFAVFGGVLLIGAIVGYLLARWHYEGVRKQIDFLKDRNAHLEKVPPSTALPSITATANIPEPEMIGLLDAARKAFDATRDTPVAEMALSSDDRSTESILHWYSMALAQRLSVYGTWDYASEPTEIDLKPGSENFMLVISGEATVYGGSARNIASDIHVVRSELAAAIKDLKKLGRKVA
ncbi:hypothetical protein [Bradyrhizobium sp. OK095]|uniref:hypothetical protein n=1 Tax=Bradyrhizobium sp. OK095 TaxID=1882760 RepID=UPI0008D855C4|nr:hypothetical protein [Bradyrhizobium sp. OK095]SEO08981.1 hypothetical protein SAMN05443254_117141 [Bradyrhizobium sp. OK095]